MTGSWEDVVNMVNWDAIAYYMAESKWGWANLGMRSPSVKELRAAAEDRHHQMSADSATIEISGGGLKVRRSRSEDGEEWEIIFDIAGSPFSPLEKP